MKIYIDEELPKSCASCQFLVHCDECEGHENYCPFVGDVGHDISDNLIDGAPITPSSERHDECPLEHRPYGEWVEKPWGVVCSRCKAQALHTPNGNQSRSDYCPDCGASMRKEGEAE